MKTKKLLGMLLGVIFLIWLSACSAGQPTAALPAPDPTRTAALTPSSTPFPTSHPTRKAAEFPAVSPTLVPTPAGIDPGNQNIKYQLTAHLDYPGRKLFVEQGLVIPHPGETGLDELILVVPPNAWQRVFFVEEITYGDGQPVEGYQLQGVRLTLPLRETWQPGRALKLRISYRLDLPIQNAREGYGPSPFGYSQLQTNLVDWYPMVPPYDQEQGWIVHQPWIFGEYLVYPAADFEVSLLVTGRQDVMVAASAREELAANVRLYRLQDARNFVFSISPDYVQLEQQVGETQVYGYIFPTYRTAGEAAFQTTVEAFSLFQELYGPYDQSSLSMVQADFNHGMEYEGLYFQSKGFFDTYNGSEKNFLTTIAAHETAHQWWYGQVANDQALEPWLDEALCTFSELVYYEHQYPEAVDWWWATRVNYYQPQGPIDGSIYDYTDYQDQYLAYRDATYLQGAKFLYRLRNAMGKEAFTAFLQEYADSYSSQIASGADFFQVLNRYLDLQSLDWLGDYFSHLPG